jgi:ABC-type nitrate/sulfonate/bicarbonate transport system permease component
MTVVPMPRRLSLRRVGFLAPLVVVLVVWTVAALLLAPIRVVPTPWSVVAAWIGDLSIWPVNILATLKNAAIGYVAGNAIAILLAIVFVRVEWAERVLMRIAVVTFCVPLVAITPILTVLFPDDVPKQILAAISVFFTTLVSCVLGLRSVSSATVDLVRSMGGSEGDVLRHARVVAMLPSLFAGLQIAAPAAVLGTILGEYLGANEGLGVLLVQAQSAFQIPRAWGVAFTMAALAGIVYWAAGRIGAALTPWVSKDVSTAVGQDIQAEAGLTAAKNAGFAALGLLGSVAVVIAVWWGVILAFDLSPYFAKTPADVITHLVTAPEAAANRSLILDGLLITLRDAGIGYLVGTVLASGIAVLVVSSAAAERFVMPLAIVMRSIPIVAMTPLLALVFGRGLAGVTVIVALVTFFPTLVTVATALRSTPALACDVVRSMGGSTAQVMTRVRLLYALPALFSAARVAVPGAVAGATLAEWLATGEGLGSMLVQDYAASRFSSLWSESVVIVAVSVLLYAVIGFIERPVTRRFAMATR